MIRLLLVLMVIGSSVLAQQRVEGRVVDAETGKPIPFASLAIEETSQGTSANLTGQFSLIVPDTFSIRVTCIGYETKVLRSVEELQVIKLKAIATQLKEVYVFNKAINPNKIVRKAFASVPDNYYTQSFLQKFFYRHYSKTDSVYEKLIEASAEVWKQNGYRATRKNAGEKEEMRVTQLRRSLDITGMVQGQRPLQLGYILQSDVAGYETLVENSQINVFEGSSNLRTDFARYVFVFDGITTYDGQEVYKIDYTYKKDSVLTSRGYKILPQDSGSLFIATDNYAFIKTEDVRYDGFNTVRTTAFYRKYGGKYYPYHFIREGENRFIDKRISSFHIELISLEIRHTAEQQFTGIEPGREDLLKIPYDSNFWNNTSILKTTPLEDEIIYDLGGGISLNKQFYLYRQYELNVTDGGNNGEAKFDWLLNESKGKRMLYLLFWDSNFKSYLADLEYLKQLNLIFKNQVTFVLISLENEEATWQQLLIKYNLFADGIVNYRVGANSDLGKRFNVKDAPVFVLVSKQGDIDRNVKRPKDPTLQADLKILVGPTTDQQ